MKNVYDDDLKILSKYKKINTLTNIPEKLADQLEIYDDQQVVRILGLISLVDLILLLIILTGLYAFLYKRADNVRFRSKSNINGNRTQSYSYNSNDSLSSERIYSECSTSFSDDPEKTDVPPCNTPNKIPADHVVEERASHTENYWNSHCTLRK